jgi:cytidylate kinase
MMLITVDGPAGAGKGTVCRLLAREYNLIHIESGLFYRSLGYGAYTQNVDFQNSQALEKLAENHDFSDLHNPHLRSEEVAQMASKISVIPAVREIVNKKLQDLFHYIRPPFNGLIADGRDMGTVVFKNAPVKIYLTADSEIRAQRRARELSKEEASLSKEVSQRDERDSARQVAPMEAAPDAHVVDSTHMEIEKVITEVKKIMRKAYPDLDKLIVNNFAEARV